MSHHEGLMRLQKFLAHAGIESRRKCEQLIAEGRIQVNGKIIYEFGTKVDPEIDFICCDGKRVRLFSGQKRIYLLLNKPKGYITSREDEKGRPTVMDLLPPLQGRVYPIGRLDYYTEGLLLLTNDGELCHTLSHPRHQIARTYLAKIKGIPTEFKLAQLTKGVTLKGEHLVADSVRIIRKNPHNTWVSIILREGKNREIRKLLEAIGHPALKLKRTRFASLRLGNLEPGKYRFLTQDEVKKLKNF